MSPLPLLLSRYGDKVGQRKAMLHALKDDGYTLAIASRCWYPDVNRRYLGWFGLWDEDLWSYRELYPTGPNSPPEAPMHPTWGRNKERHFLRLQEDSGYAFEDMVFFDDLLEGNVQYTEERFGLIAVHTPDGVEQEHIDEALARWADLRLGQEDEAVAA